MKFVCMLRMSTFHITSIENIEFSLYTDTIYFDINSDTLIYIIAHDQILV